MNIRQLDAFRAVMKTGSVSNAAQWMHLSQPAVSRLISDLERSVDFKLFIRSKGSSVTPTSDAETLYQEVERSFAGLEALKHIAEDIRNFKSGNLRIAALPALALGFLPNVLEKFLAEHPSVNVQLQTRSSSTVRQWVAAQQFDLGLARPGEFHGVEMRSFVVFDGVCILPPGHKLSSRTVITAEDLQGENFISLGLEDYSRSRIDEVFQSAGIKRNVVVETQYAATICGLVMRGVGCSVINPVTAMDYIGSGLVIRPFTPSIKFEYMLFLPSYRPSSRLADIFISQLEKERDRFVQLADQGHN